MFVALISENVKLLCLVILALIRLKWRKLVQHKLAVLHMQGLKAQEHVVSNYHVPVANLMGGGGNVQ